MIGCPLSWKCILAWRCGEESQQPTCPQVRHRRKWTHLEPILRQSSQPSALGVTSRIIFRCGSTISFPSLPVRRSADRSAPRSGAISHLCGAQLIFDRQLADSLHVAAIDPDHVEQSGRCYQALSHWPRLGDFRLRVPLADIVSPCEGSLYPSLENYLCKNAILITPPISSARSKLDHWCSGTAS
jgi:hypothetical protein